MYSETFELSLDPSQTHSWGVWEGTREFIQNWMDNPNDKTWYYDENSETLGLINLDTHLDRSVFLMGKSNKRDDKNTIGKYGDGLSSSIACLIREGKSIQIYNSGVVWKPTIIQSKVFSQEVVAIEETELMSNHPSFDVHIKGITLEEMEEIKENALCLQDDLGEVFETTEGSVLLEDKYTGNIYCGGLFVTNISGMQYGYDFKPSYLSLDRDRQTVRDFDVQWITRKMISRMGKDSQYTDSIVSMLQSNKKDTEYMHCAYVPQKVADKCYEDFSEKYPETALAGSTEEQEQLTSAGYKSVFLGNGTLTSAIKQGKGYESVNFDVVVDTPYDLVVQFKEDYDALLTPELQEGLDELADKVYKVM